MADYYPLLARALDGVDDPTREARDSVYGRARAALGSQLRSIDPALPASEVARELASLDDAIDRIERSYAYVRRPDDPPAIAIEPVGDNRRVRAEPTPAIRRGSRGGRSLLVAAGLVAVIAPIAVFAWLWRDQPEPAPVVEAPRPAAPQTPAVDPKRPERMGGRGPGTAPSDPPSTTPAPTRPPASSPTAQPSPGPQAAPPTVQPDVPVAQRAALIEEVPSEPQQPKIVPGRVLWRIDAINTGQGQPLETVVRATIDIPDAKMSLALALRRNRDTTLPASHTIELTFTTATAGEDARSVRDVNPPQIRSDDQNRGVPIAALSVPVKENVFLIGLSSLASDIDRNTDLLIKRNWIELPIRFSSGTRGTLVFEKGITGDRVMSDAFKQWAQP